MKVLVTGAAGFIGAQVSHKLCKRGDEVVGIDNLNNYYDPALKKARLEQLENKPGFRFQKLDIGDNDDVKELFRKEKFNKVINLAAQAGVRYSIENPLAYVDTNMAGFVHLLEGCRWNDIEHLVFASSSSVYGTNTKMPFSVHDNVDHPISLYAASKKSNELMAHTYAHLYGIPATGLRFFTVYGPWGRPDMALFLFANNIMSGKPINVFNFGKHARDFTYIDDIAEGVVRTLDRTASPNPGWNSDAPDPATSNVPFRIYNIGNNQPVELMYFIELIEKNLGKKAEINYLPLQNGDVPKTFADIDDLVSDVGFKPDMSIEDGVERTITWYKDFYNK